MGFSRQSQQSGTSEKAGRFGALSKVARHSASPASRHCFDLRRTTLVKVWLSRTDLPYHPFYRRQSSRRLSTWADEWDFTLTRHTKVRVLSPKRKKTRVGRTDTQTGMLPGVPGSTTCVQRFDDSRNSAIHITYRISLRSSSLREPRHPLLKVVYWFVFT